jgi:hypothetical protein
MAVKQMFGSKVVRIGICLMITVFGANLLSAETKVPNEFTSGTPAKASEVNENFSDLNSKIEAISKPESSYSVLSTETLDSGLVRTKLYAFEEGSIAESLTWEGDPSNEDLVGRRDNSGSVVNALGRFQTEGRYRTEFFNLYSEADSIFDDVQYASVNCPDGSQILRAYPVIYYTRTFQNSAGGFVLSSHDNVSTGTFDGCVAVAQERGEPEGASIRYVHLEGRGSGIYSCVSRAAYYGSTNGGDGKGFQFVRSPPLDRTRPYPLKPSAYVGTFDRSSNGKWGTYYLEIDAPAGCITLSGPAPAPAPAPVPAPAPAPVPAPVPDDPEPDMEPAPAES